MESIRQNFRYLNVYKDRHDEYIKAIPKLQKNITNNIDGFNNNNLNDILFGICYYLDRLYNLDQQNKNIFDNLIITVLQSKNLKQLDDYTTVILCTRNENLYDELILQEKIKPSFEQLVLACKNIFQEEYNVKLIQKILEHKIIPTHECFKYLFDKKAQTYTIIHNIRVSIVKPYRLLYKVDEIVNYMINFGLTLNLTDVKELASRSIEIDIKKFDIIPDDELINICLDNKFFPKYLDNIKYNETQIHKLFEKRYNIDFIKSIIKKQNIKCDITCLQNACNIKRNNVIIDFLIDEQKIKPDLICAKSIVKNSSSSDTIKKLIYLLPS
jgi:hypothetical protein